MHCRPPRPQASPGRRPQAGRRHWVDNGLVFTIRYSTPIEPRNFNRSFDRCIRAARVPRITVHGTRKTCASLLAALDAHPRIAMRILRHSKINATMEIYPRTPPATRCASSTTCSDNPVAALCCRTTIKKGQFRDRNRPLTWVELRGFKPPTPSMRTSDRKVNGGHPGSSES